MLAHPRGVRQVIVDLPDQGRVSCTSLCSRCSAMQRREPVALLQKMAWQCNMPHNRLNVSWQTPASCALHRVGELPQHAIAKEKDTSAFQKTCECDHPRIALQTRAENVRVDDTLQAGLSRWTTQRVDRVGKRVAPVSALFDCEHAWRHVQARTSAKVSSSR
eukprot:5532331-Prymnesium_polylepis.1